MRNVTMWKMEIKLGTGTKLRIETKWAVEVKLEMETKF